MPLGVRRYDTAKDRLAEVDSIINGKQVRIKVRRTSWIIRYEVRKMFNLHKNYNNLNFIMFRNKELFLTGRGKSIMDVEMEKRKFLNLCGKRDQALLSGEKRMTLGDMERLTYLTEFFELENYGIALWKEFGDDVKEPFEAMMKMLDEPECIEDRWLDDEAKGEKWLLEFQELALTEEYREWIRNYIDKKYEERGLPYPTGADFD